MHQSVMEFLRREVHAPEISGKSVLEVGSYDVNGSPRTVVVPMKPSSYLGVDFCAGPGVDRVLDASRLVESLGAEKFDVVLSTEMLEHARDWKSAVSQMKRVLKPGGLLVVTTRGPGFPYHGYPHDYWRFTLVDFRVAFQDMLAVLQADPEAPGVFLKARKPADWAEADLSLVAPAPAPSP